MWHHFFSISHLLLVFELSLITTSRADNGQCVTTPLYKISAPSHDADYDCSPSSSVVTWSVADQATGAIDLTIPISCNLTATYYALKLGVSERNLSEGCVASDASETRPIHTHKYYQLERRCVDSKSACNWNFVARFSFVFTGCYEVELFECKLPGLICGKHISTWHNLFIETLYQKKLLANHPFSLIPRHQGYLAFDTILADLLPLPTTLTVKLNSTMCKNEATKVHFIPNGTVENCQEVSANPCEAKCEYAHDRLHCAWPNITSGTYQVYVEMHDLRCVGDTIWRPGREDLPCIWMHPIEIYEPAKAMRPEVVHASGATTWTSLIIGVFLTSTVLVALLVKLCARRQTAGQINEPADTTSAELPCLQPRRILLVYARDCEPFMKLMTSFARLLTAETSCRVFDCQDRCHWDEIGRNPAEWQRRLMAQPDTSIVLVATPCATIRYHAHARNEVVRYKMPEMQDELFTLAMQELVTSGGRLGYQKVFVVRLDQFSSDADLITSLNAYTRFVLPQHLASLVKHLDQRSAGIVAADVEEAIRQDLLKLVAYKQQHSDYLQQLLVRQQQLA